MQRDDEYMMSQMPSYRDHPAASSTPDTQSYFDDPSHPGNYARSPFDSTPDVAPVNFRNAQPTAYAKAPFMPPANPYENLEAPRNSDWLEKTQKSSKRSKCMVVGAILTLAVLVAAGAVVGVLLSKKHSSGSSGGAPKGTNPNDPSNFQKNPALKQSFWGVAYSPANVQLPDCGATLDSVIEDVQLLSQITTNIRLYGADCNQSSLVLAAIQETKVNLSVWLGNYPALTDNGTAYERQKAEIQTAIQQFGADHVNGITVGNEFILDAVTAAQENDPNGPAGNTAAEMLVPWILDTRSMLAGLNLGKTIPVGNADAGSYFNTKVLEASDYGMSNVHAWFANQSIQNAAGWVYEFFEQTNVALAESLPNKPQMYIAETGWPTNSSTFNYSPTNGQSDASVANLQYFIDSFACQATRNNTQYFFFEYMDMAWQAQRFGGVEGSWGIFDENKNFKNLTLPVCS